MLTMGELVNFVNFLLLDCICICAFSSAGARFTNAPAPNQVHQVHKFTTAARRLREMEGGGAGEGPCEGQNRRKWGFFSELKNISEYTYEHNRFFCSWAFSAAGDPMNFG